MDDDREKAEFKKLNLEIVKLEKEIGVLQRRPIFHPSAYMPLIVAILGLVGAGYKLNSVTTKLDTTTQQRNEAERDLTRSEAGLQSAVQRSSPGLLTVVNIKFRGSLSRDKIIGLQQEFTKNGIISPRATRTDEIQGSSVIFYDPNDQPLADSIAGHVRAYFAGQGCPLDIAPAQRTNPNVSERTIELDVYHSCS